MSELLFALPTLLSEGLQVLIAVVAAASGLAVARRQQLPGLLLSTFGVLLFVRATTRVVSQLVLYGELMYTLPMSTVSSVVFAIQAVMIVLDTLTYAILVAAVFTGRAAVARSARGAPCPVPGSS